MNRQNLLKALRFYFITDDSAPGCTPLEQTRIALLAGATIVQYRNKSFSEDHLAEVVRIRELCRERGAPLIINDNIPLARRVAADGVHVGQDDAAPAVARQALGDNAIVGVSVSTPEELVRTDLPPCDYIGTGPVFPTGTKVDAKAVRRLAGLREIVGISPLPVVAIGGITADNAPGCFTAGAAGVAVISFVSRAADPLANARRLAAACSAARRP